MNLIRPSFALSTLIVLTAVTAIAMGVKTQVARQIARTKSTYDAQKRAVRKATEDLVAELTQAGYHVANDSQGVGGSGEWREYVAVAAASSDGLQHVCYVEVMGFVSHDANDQPTWMEVLPMKISHQGGKANHQYLQHLFRRLDEQGWKYDVDNECRGDLPIRMEESGFYLLLDEKKPAYASEDGSRSLTSGPLAISV